MYNDEIWKPVPEYEGFYEVSNYGRVRGIKRNKILKPSENPNGYFKVHLSKNGNDKFYYIHRLVLMAFTNQSSEDIKEVNHKNKLKYDNRLCNLEWTTHEENMYHKHNWHSQFQILNLFTNEWDDLV